MKIAVDVDGTLSRKTESLKKLMKSLFDGGHTVFILTSSLGGTPSTEERITHLESMNVLPEIYTELKICDGTTLDEVANLKGEFCRDNEIDMLFEDMDPFIAAVNRLSPATSTWLVRDWNS